jgi:hypothetical protein
VEAFCAVIEQCEMRLLVWVLFSETWVERDSPILTWYYGINSAFDFTDQRHAAGLV